MLAEPHSTSDAAKQRLLSTRGDPFLFAAWENVLFLHFLISPDLVRPEMPSPFELELYDGHACVSLVALSMSHFKPNRSAALGSVLRMVRQQRFLNLRMYVRANGESGAFFLWGWLSRAYGMSLPVRLLSLPCSFGSLAYDHKLPMKMLRGSVRAGTASERLGYRAPIPSEPSFELCPPGSLAEFALERYTGFFCKRSQPQFFRAWHAPWLQTSVDVTIEDLTLITRQFPWFKNAKLCAANFSPGFPEVWLGRAHAWQGKNRRQSVLSAFYQMP